MFNSEWRGPQACSSYAGPCREAPEQVEEFQKADWGGRGDCSFKFGKIQKSTGIFATISQFNICTLLKHQQAEAEEAEERAGLNEQAMSKLRVLGRAGSAAPFL